jgi:hypothetical protein
MHCKFVGRGIAGDLSIELEFVPQTFVYLDLLVTKHAVFLLIENE